MRTQMHIHLIFAVIDLVCTGQLQSHAAHGFIISIERFTNLYHDYMRMKTETQTGIKPASNE